MTLRSIFRKLVGFSVLGVTMFFAAHFLANWTYDAGAQTVAQNAAFQVYASYNATGVYPAATPTGAATPGDIGALLNAADVESLPSSSAGGSQTAQYWSDGARYVMVVTDTRSGHHFCIDSGSPDHQGLHQVDLVTDCIG